MPCLISVLPGNKIKYKHICTISITKVEPETRGVCKVKVFASMLVFTSFPLT